MYVCKKCGAKITKEQNESLQICQRCFDEGLEKNEVKNGREWMCPLGHWTAIEIIGYRGMLGFANLLAICKTCGIVFDQSKVEERQT